MCVFVFLGVLVVSGCVGEFYYYYYGVMEVYFSVFGCILNVLILDIIVYLDGLGNGYVFVYVKGDDVWDFGISGVFLGDCVFVVMVVMLLIMSFGLMLILGSVIMLGEYNVIWIDVYFDDLENWLECNCNGIIDIQFLFDFSSSFFYGLFDDGWFELYGIFGGFDNNYLMIVEYDNFVGLGGIYVDSDEVVGIFVGIGINDFYVGGVQVEDQDFKMCVVLLILVVLFVGCVQFDWIYFGMV